MTSQKKRPHYVSNKELLRHLIEYKVACKAAAEAGKPTPKIPEEIGHAFLRIAENFAKKGSFAMYSYKDDLIGDALENCVHYIYRFDENRSSNPFAYFTQIIKNAFKRRINNEGKESYVKYKSLEVSPIYHEHLSSSGESKKQINTVKNAVNDHSNGIIDKFENRMKRQKIKRIQKKFEGIGVEQFMDLD